MKSTLKDVIQHPIAARLAQWYRRGLSFLERHKWLVPLISFVAGVASFVFVDRQAEMATWIVATLLLSWIWFESENWVAKLFKRLTTVELPPILTSFTAQALHQETLFFTIPFVMAYTAWNTPHIIFAAIVIGLALLSLLDNLYHPMVSVRWVRALVHGFMLFLVIFVSLPQIVQLTTTASLKIACAAMAIINVPAVYRALSWPLGIRIPAAVVLSALLGFTAWLARPLIPPTNLRLKTAYPSLDLNRETREGHALEGPVPMNQLANGIYLFSAIQAPLGLTEDVYHEWYWKGELMDRVELKVAGGREEGYRSWSRKDHFPPDPRGTWKVRITTLSGLHLGDRTFQVVDAQGEASPQPTQQPKPAAASESDTPETPRQSSEPVESSTPPDSDPQNQEPAEVKDPPDL